MKSLKDIRNDFHAQLLLYRSIDALICSDEFEIAFGKASMADRRSAIDAVEKLDRDYIRSFIDKWLRGTGPFEQMSIRKLREIGKHLRIPNYHVLGKLILIREIENEVQRVKELTERIINQSKQQGVGCPPICIGGEQSAVLVDESQGVAS